MSLSATCRAFQAACPHPCAKLILIALGDWADEYGHSPVIVRDLMDFSGIDTEAAFERHLKSLVQTGHITLQSSDRNGERFAIFSNLEAIP